MGKGSMFLMATLSILVGQVAWGVLTGLAPRETAMRWYFTTWGIGIGLLLAWLQENWTPR